MCSCSDGDLLWSLGLKWVEGKEAAAVGGSSSDWETLSGPRRVLPCSEGPCLWMPGPEKKQETVMRGIFQTHTKTNYVTAV